MTAKVAGAGGGAARTLMLTVAFAASIIGGCATSSKPTSTRSRVPKEMLSSGGSSPGVNPDRPLDPIDNPQGSSISLRVRSAIMPVGSVPYDGFSLPLISPDGRYVATQTGAPPDWAVTLADPDARVPADTMIEVYRLDNRSVAPEERQLPTLVAHLDIPAVLGRSVDDRGFLIESPREDGSRHIGKVTWDTGEVAWLVEGPDVNAFAALAPDGRLAWSRRAIDGERFDLVVRDLAGNEWAMPGRGGDWLMPVWSGSSDGLFVLHHQDRRLRICYGLAVGAQAYLSSLRDFLLEASADRYAPWQAFGAQTAVDGMLSTPTPEILLFHPGLGRMIIWQPLKPREKSATQLNAQSLAALQQSADVAVVSTRDDLLLQSLKQARSHISLVKGVWVPRRTPQAEWPYMLISTGADGRVGLTAMRLMPYNDAVAPSTDATSR